MQQRPMTNFLMVAARLFAAMVVLIASLALPGSQATAQSQNEVLVNVLYDGTPSFDAGDPIDAVASDPQPHTPGDDGGPNNLVVRTWDQFAVRVDWNINEDNAQDAVLEVVLPPNTLWAPDDSGMFSGCDPALSSFSDPVTLLCHLGDQPEGSNGAIRAVAQNLENFDNTLLDVQATLTTADDQAGVSDNLDQPLTVSESPVVDYQKDAPIVSDPITVGGNTGRVFLFPIAVIDYSQSVTPPIGAGPILDSAGFEFWDHMWGMTNSARLATQAELDEAELSNPAFAGSPCGIYEGTGDYVSGPETWTCSAPANPNGYTVVPVTATNFTSRPYVPQYASGNANNPEAPMVAAGQIAVWADEADIQIEVANPDNDSNVSAKFYNSITQLDEGTDISDPSQATEAESIGTSGPSTGGSEVNNTASGFVGVSPPPSGDFSNDVLHDVKFAPGPLHLFSTTRRSPIPRVNIDRFPTGWLPGATSSVHAAPAPVGDLIGEVARGSLLTIYSFVVTAGSNEFEAPLHGCVAFDTEHYSLTGFGNINVRDVGAGRSLDPTVGESTISSNTGPLAHMTLGDAESWWWGDGLTYNALGGGVEWPYRVEFTNAPVTRWSGQSFGAVDDGLTCNDADAGPAGWVDATDTDGLAVFDTVNQNDGVYEGITWARYSAYEGFPWDGPGGNARGMRVFFQARVKADIDDQSQDQELFAMTSHSFGEFVGGVPTLDRYPTIDASDCAPQIIGDWTDSGNDVESTTGWCNNRFEDDGIDSTDTNDVVDWDNDSGILKSDFGSGAVVRIVEAQLAFSKSNLDGVADIKDNGQLVQFSLQPSVVGSTQEALTDVKLTDTLPAYYEFVRFVEQPGTPGATCSEASGTINCQFSAPDPSAPGAMAAGLAGGWSDEVIIEVMVTGAIANPDSPTVLQNEATATSTGLGPWDPDAGVFEGDVVDAAKEVSGTAYSYMPLPADEGAIIKAVETLEGPCNTHPTEDPVPAGWSDRCSMIDYNGNMSFLLSLTNEGNTAFTNLEIVDVFPYVGDATEPASDTPNLDGSPPTIGDGRTPPSDFVGSLDYVSMTPVATPAGSTTTVLITSDDPATISRDPAVTKATNTWCDASTGALVFGSGTCPIAAADATATFTHIDGTLNPDQTVEFNLTLDAQDHECDDIYTNTFGARVDQLFLPIRSNDVSIMVNCEFDLALRKTVDPAWAPGADWVSSGVSTVDFLLEVFNQGDPVNTFEVTDYIDPTMFSFDIGENPGGTTQGSHALGYTWDASGANPVVVVNNAAHPLHQPSSNLIATGDSIIVPVTLTISPSYETPRDLDNRAEISYFDNDDDPTNGDSNTGLVDVDSLPDGVDGDPLVDDVIDNSAGDEDDHDIASIPVYDVAIDKSNPNVFLLNGNWMVSFDVTVVNESNAAVTNVNVLETPPPGLQYNSSEAATTTATDVLGAAVVVSDTDPTYVVDSLAPGDSVTFTILYDVKDRTLGPYINSVQIASFLDPNGNVVPDADSAPGNDDDHEARNEDDDDIESAELPFDMALVKKPQPMDPNFPDLLDGLQDNDEVLFYIEVFNQLATVEDFDVIDYIGPGWEFVLSSQISPQITIPGSGGGPALPYTWTFSGTSPVANVEGILPGGDSIIIPIVLTADVPNQPVVELENTAEILRFDDDGDPTNGDSTDGTVEDYDSTPDGINSDLLVDDEYNDDGTVDEDDHDIASTTWYDVAIEKQLYDGTDCVDGPRELTPMTTSVEYCIAVSNEGPTDLFDVSFVDTPPPGLAFDTNSELPSGATYTAGTYTIEDLLVGESVLVRVVYTLNPGDVVGPLVNVVEVTEMFADAAGTDPAEDVDSYVDPTPDADEPTEDDEDDEEVVLPYDLALAKTLVAVDGSQVTMNLTVTNQSSGVETIEVTDYIDATMWEAFSAADNPPGTATGPAADFAYFWDDTDPLNPVVSISPVVMGNKFAYQESLSVPIVLTISDGWDSEELENFAEISNFDNDADPDNGDASDGSLTDFDSTPDADDGNSPGESINYVDDEIDEYGANGGDEDDHDGVAVTVFDLALTKTLDPATTQPVSPGDEVVFLIEVTNQGNTHANAITLIDYTDVAMFEPFDATLGDNDNGSSTTGDQNFPFQWQANGDDGEVTITGILAPGESIIVPVTQQVVSAPAVTELDNVAEISGGLASDAAGTTVTQPNGDPLLDRDSVADTDNTDTLVDDVTDNTDDDEDDHDIATVIVADPAIDIEKDTNGVQSDLPPGDQLMEGELVTWTYVVTNTGTTALLNATVADSDAGLIVDCSPTLLVTPIIPLLLPGESTFCTATGDATLGSYDNTGTVTGTPAWPSDPTVDPSDPASWPTNPIAYAPTSQDPVEDQDDSHYFGTVGGLEVEKATNLVDADEAPGVGLTVGDAVSWTYEVTNTSPVMMLAIEVTDSDIGTAIDCGAGTNVIALLAPGASVTCMSTAPATAVAGAYRNDSDVEGIGALPSEPLAPGVELDDPTTWPTDASGYTPTPTPAYTAADPSNYFAVDGGITLEKATNGSDSDQAPGAHIEQGDDVTWTYAVTNASNATMIDVVVDDLDAAITVDCGGGSDRIPVLAVGETVTCSATGTATLGQYQNDSTVSGTPAIEDPANPGGPSEDPASYVAVSDTPSTDEDPSHYFGVDPSITIEKSTNGDDADETLGPILAPGDSVEWTYEVTNTGTVALSPAVVTDNDASVTVVCDSGTNEIAVLLPNESATCTAQGTAVLGNYENIADVEGTPVQLTDPANDPADAASYEPSGLDPVTDDDPSHYLAISPSVVIEKATNGHDADVAPGPIVTPGAPVTWTYIVENDGNVPLVDLLVTDDQGVVLDCGDNSNVIDELAVGGSHTCTGTGEGATGNYANTGTVVGNPAMEDDDGNPVAISGADPVTDDDPSHHLGLLPALDVEKLTNGDQADATLGPLLSPGDAVEWTYEVTNSGEVPLADVTVRDDDPAIVVDCGDGTAVVALLLPGELRTCTATGVAVVGAYENIADAMATPVAPVDPAVDCCDPADAASWPTDPSDYEPTGQEAVGDSDPSHYVAHDGEILIEKSTNSVDADEAPGPVIAPGDEVTWSYTIVNFSDTPLVNIVVTDDQGEAVDCGNGSSIDVLLPGETYKCTATGIAGTGQYTNVGSVAATAGEVTDDGSYQPIPEAEQVTDTDPSNYFGAVPSIDIEKATNGEDSDVAPGENILEGDPVDWTYVVTNTGAMTLVDATVTDDDPTVDVDCGDGTNVIAVLEVGASATCTAAGIAAAAEYANIGAVTGLPAVEDAVTGDWVAAPGATAVDDDDPSHYTGVELEFDLALRKTVLSSSATLPATQKFALELFNQGTVSAANITVVDYLPEGMELDDDDWTLNSDGNATINVAGPIAPGASFVIEIDTAVSSAGSYDNIAAIEAAQAVHPDSANALPLFDVDSTLGDGSEDALVNDVIDNRGGDEDDSDGASVAVKPKSHTTIPGTPIQPPSPMPSGFGNSSAAQRNTGTTTTTTSRGPLGGGPLALTGSNAGRLALVGAVLIVSGGVLVMGSKRRRRDDEGPALDWQNMEP